MAALIYSAIMSLDGFVADVEGGFSWAAPDEQVHAFVNDLERPVGTFLYGRRMYEVMAYWQTAGAEPSGPPVVTDFAAIWRSAEKVVYSTTLASVTTPRTRLEQSFDVETVRRLKSDATRDVTVGGPDLAGQAINAGLVDEYQMIVVPVVVGGGTRAFARGVTASLHLVDEHRFDNGFVYLRYLASDQKETE
jgi:dihydrofolate reductase